MLELSQERQRRVDNPRRVQNPSFCQGSNLVCDRVSFSSIPAWIRLRLLDSKMTLQSPRLMTTIKPCLSALVSAMIADAAWLLYAPPATSFLDESQIAITRWLDKAAIVEEQFEDYFEKQKKKGELCTVREVKSLVPLMYLGFTFFACSLVVASGNTFFVGQVSNLKPVIFGNGANDIPLLFVIMDIVSDMSSFICWIFNLKKFRLVTRRLVTNFRFKRIAATIMRVGIGMVFAISCCIRAWQVEAHSLSLVKKEGIVEDSDKEISMTTRALLPQFLLLGVTEGLVEDGLTNLFHGYVAESMWNLEESFTQSVMGTGKLLTIPCVLIFSSWFKETVNTSHLDRYFLMLAILNCVPSHFCVLLFEICIQGRMSKG